ncbi:hypothetical protein BZG36_00494 [Bifiguratus adelaidae]|uniref:Deacetylase sirtuin-type domain-containing protein n=1 Tax=Bifiguratus adelaidae TaxID=1938954 RepID=A0A261Y7B0_9FUNG|nr:hypothetical protein BZG36_00494 [Bifiguratus adelaidae]
MAELKQIISEAKSTPTHVFIKSLVEQGKLIRCYTQNIDCLEDLVNLQTDFISAKLQSSPEPEINPEPIQESAEEKQVFKDNTNLLKVATKIEDYFPPCQKRPSSSMSHIAIPSPPSPSPSTTTVAKPATPSSNLCRNLHVVQLHGTINKVKCTVCNEISEFSPEHLDIYRKGNAPPCPTCSTMQEVRQVAGKRQTNSGILRPAIVLYNEHHPHGEEIGELQAHDLKKRPDMLIIMGTSLKIIGLKRFIKEAAKIVHSQKNGKVVFINRTACTKEWERFIDWQVLGDTDDWVNYVETASQDRSSEEPQTQKIPAPIKVKKQGRENTHVPDKPSPTKKKKVSETSKQAAASTQSSIRATFTRVRKAPCVVKSKEGKEIKNVGKASKAGQGARKPRTNLTPVKASRVCTKRKR